MVQQLTGQALRTINDHLDLVINALYFVAYFFYLVTNALYLVTYVLFCLLAI
jgi:hypothetical protein